MLRFVYLCLFPASVVTNLYLMSVFCVGEVMLLVRLYPIFAFVFEAVRLYSCLRSYMCRYMYVCFYMHAYIVISEHLCVTICMFACICFWCSGVCIGTLFSCVV
jgi:hypothetical protein